MSKYMKALKGATTEMFLGSSSGHTTRSASRVGSDMSIDPPAAPTPASSSTLPPKILLKSSQLVLKDDREKALYKKLKNKVFTHTPVLDHGLLKEASMDFELDIIFSLVEWGLFWNITELGSKLLTIEFLYALQTTNTGVTFRLFAREFSLTWRELSNLLGFPTNAALDLDTALVDFDRHKFWSEISRDFIFYQPYTSDMEHPTLRFLHKWMGFAFFP
jgi:hypothetical protein